MLQRELRVAFSKTHQPIWVRLLKWAVIVLAIWWFHDARYFWQAVAALVVGALLLHLFYRYQTRKWTRAWGGWKDVDAVN